MTGMKKACRNVYGFFAEKSDVGGSAAHLEPGRQYAAARPLEQGYGGGRSGCRRGRHHLHGGLFPGGWLPRARASVRHQE